MYLGVDLGTSGIKVIITDEKGDIVDSQSAELSVERPKPLFSEQDPQQWWLAFNSIMQALSERRALAQVKAIGLSGQMHGAVLLNASGGVIRPAILWNDGRSAQECKELEDLVPKARQLTGNMMMPGFTAPKLLWVKKHEADNFAQIDKVLLPKDYLRYLLTGVFASDMSDSAGTMWLNTGTRCWNNELLAACGLSSTHMPELFEGNEVTGHLHASLCKQWGMQANMPVIAGGGDNAAGAIGVGLTQPGQAMLSLGTSGVYFVVANDYKSQPDMAVHSFCHALPNTWHLMSVILSAASCVQWFADSVVEQDVGDLFASLESNDQQSPLNQAASQAYFLPYLSGERTPHNNPDAKGCFIGLSHSSNKMAMLHAVLEGVSFAFADGVDALHASGAQASEITVIGGGAKSPYWRQMLADVLNRTIVFRSGGDVGPALGAARLAQLAANPDMSVSDICQAPEVVCTHTPNKDKHLAYAKRREIYQQLYRQLADIFPAI